MRLFLLRTKREKFSDEEYIERLRKTVAVAERWRKRMLGFYSLAMVGLIGIIILTNQAVGAINQLANNQAAFLGFGLGITLGAMVGLLAVHTVHGFISYLTMSFRAERLLIRCYDAIQEFQKLPNPYNGNGLDSKPSSIPANSRLKTDVRSVCRPAH